MTLNKFKIGIVIFFIVCSIIGWYPFFVFNYFETHKALVTTTKYFLPLIVLVTIPSVTLFYYKKLKKLNATYKFKSKTHEKRADFSNCFLLILVMTAILFAISYSTIITTNAYFGNSESIFINENVQDYYTHTDKYGKLRHYIKFYSPVDKTLIEMQVYRQYDIGEKFEKEMKIGRWNILYSKK
ncbi:MAG: hypothetical protein ACM3O3_10380 [Syntrophothermus sp.]